MTRDEHHGLGGRSLFWPGGNHLPDSRAGVHRGAMPPPGRFEKPGRDRAIIAHRLCQGRPRQTVPYELGFFDLHGIRSLYTHLPSHPDINLDDTS